MRSKKNIVRTTALSFGLIALAAGQAIATSVAPSAAETAPKVPAFSLDYMDKSVDPSQDFYKYAAGTWIKNNPVPADKSRWSAFNELNDRNMFLIHGILEAAQNDKSAAEKSPTKLVGNFYSSAMNTAKLEELKFKPIEADLARIDKVSSNEELIKLMADFHKSGIGCFFSPEVQPDAKNSSIYAFYVNQGGLSLPDRDYYLTENFATQRKAYKEHVTKMFTLLGESAADAEKHAATVLAIETNLAKASRSRVELRDPIKNYKKVENTKLVADSPNIQWNKYFTTRELPTVSYSIVGQPEFFAALDKTLKETPLVDLKTYLRWRLLHEAAPFLHNAVEEENFNFYGKVLSGQQEQEPRWKRAAKAIDGQIGEALGQLYVEKYYPPEASEKMNDLVNNLRGVFKDRLQHLEWMSDETRTKAMAKFDRFTQKIGYPKKFRDYSSVEIRPDDYLGNAERADAFEIKRQAVRIGKPVDKSEWEMTPPTVNAYFNPLYNEIVFPAGILQPPFFDLSADDAVNYGAIGAVIGHEITHGYDDEGRKYDADGNLTEWWTEKDGKEFDARAKKVVEEYNEFEPLPGLHVNGELTLGENIADLGGVTIGYDAMERAFKKDPSKRKDIGGFTPEQRFFLSFAQIWRSNIRDAEAKRLLTVDPHSPGRYRSYGPLMNFQPWYDAFKIKEGSPMWRAPEKRAKIW